MKKAADEPGKPISSQSPQTTTTGGHAYYSMILQQMQGGFFKMKAKTTVTIKPRHETNCFVNPLLDPTKNPKTIFFTLSSK